MARRSGRMEGAERVFGDEQDGMRWIGSHRREAGLFAQALRAPRPDAAGQHVAAGFESKASRQQFMRRCAGKLPTNSSTPAAQGNRRLLNDPGRVGAWLRPRGVARTGIERSTLALSGGEYAS